MYKETNGIISYITNNLNTYISADNLNNPSLIIDTITSANVVNCYPDPEKYKYNVMIFLLAQNESIENLNIYDMATNNVHIYIVVRNDTPSNLTIKASRYMDCIDGLLKADKSLGNSVWTSNRLNSHYFDGIEGSPNTKGFELLLEVKYSI